MITQALCFRASGTDPIHNLAVEEALMDGLLPGQALLYLWQNHHTIVIGRNQNPWQELQTSLFQEDGGVLVRRLSGGGAVYHDLGNLNFTFLCRGGDYSVPRQLSVVLRAVGAFKLNAAFTGRNDLEIQGRKFSGSAYFSKGDAHCHHGTLLIRSDLSALSRYLAVPPQKLTGKGVSSVSSRVINLSGLCPDITVPAMELALREAFGKEYGLPLREVSPEDIRGVKEREERFASRDWIYGRRIPFTRLMEARFPWGGVSLAFDVTGGIVRECRAYTDAMDPELGSALSRLLTGRPYQGRVLSQAVSQARGLDPGQAADLELFLKTQNF